MTESSAEARLADARSGDQQAFSDVAEAYRAELLVHCYRLLGSVQDAEDMVQETFLRAWNRLDQFSGGQYFRAWLYKIATNLCLDALDKRARRGLATGSFPAADPRTPIAPEITDPIWLEPFPDELLPEAPLGPEARYSLRESITLAFLAAVQLLPPRQRVILVLCDVLDWHAREVAQMLDITVAAVNGLLRRARATMQASYHEIQAVRAMDRSIRAVLNRYVEAWESGDVDGLVALLADKVIFTMPPSPTWYAGWAAVRLHAEMMFSPQAPYRFRLLPARAHNQVALACYRGAVGEGDFQAHALQVLTFDGAQITQMDMFLLPGLFPHFGLASQTSG
jgi:RNA polymerase sigma-70 factor, ECF subfamily